MSFTTASLGIEAFSGYDISVKKEDSLYRMALHYSLRDMIESYNYFLQNNVPAILRGTYETTRNIIHVKDVEITFPQFEAGSEGTFWNTPFISKQTGSSYTSKIKIIYTERKKDNLINTMNSHTSVTSEIKTKTIGSMHILVGSSRCVTQFKPLEYENKDDWCATLSECPSSVGCYTINNGQDKTITMDQKLKTGVFMCFMTNDDTPRLECRITNMFESMTSVVRMQIGKNLPNVKVLLPFLKGSSIPLYVVFYLVYYDFSLSSTENIDFSTSKFNPLISSFAPIEERVRIVAYLASSRKKFESFFVRTDEKGTKVIPGKIKEYIQSKMVKPRASGGEVDSSNYDIDSIAKKITGELFVQCKTFREKLGVLCYMTCQTIRCAIGTRPLDSRDDLDKQKVDSFIRMQATYCTDNLLRAIRTDTEDKGFNYGKNDRKEVVVESRKCITLNETIGEMCKIANRVNVRTSSLTLRQVSEDQLGFVCPVKTPEGTSCGLVKQRSALTHISDNREYEINRYMPVADLFKPYIEYISDRITPEFKYSFFCVNNRNEILPFYYAKPGYNPTYDSVFVSSRILNLFSELIEAKKVIYYIDDNNTINMKFLEYHTLTKYAINTHLGGVLYIDIPSDFYNEFSVIALSTPNKDYKLCSSVKPVPGCEINIAFRWQGEPNKDYYVEVATSGGDYKPLNISDFFIELLHRFIGKYDKISAIKTKDQVNADGSVTPGKKLWVVTTKEPLHNFDSTHWSNVKCRYMIPAHISRQFSVLTNVMTEYISYEKSKTYSSSLSFNGTVVLDPTSNGFYPRPVWVNGKKTEEYFRKKRRQGVVAYDSFAHYDEKDNNVGYYDDPGRLMTPMLIVDENGDLIIDRINSWEKFCSYEYDKSKTFITSLYKEGCMEMIDAKEMDSTLLAVDIDECRGFNKLRKFLNMVDLEKVNSSIFQIRGSDYFKNEDFTSVRINGNHHDIEFSTVDSKNDVKTFTQDGVVYYGNYVIKKNVGNKLSTPIQKLVRPDNGTIMDTYNLIYRDTSSHNFFKRGDFKFVTDDMDPEFDGTHIYVYNNKTERLEKFEIFTLDFGKKAGEKESLKECYIDETCAIINVKSFTRPSLDKDTYNVVDGKIIDDSLLNGFFYIKNELNEDGKPKIDKDGKPIVKYVVPDKYIFPDNELTTVFDIKQEKIHQPLLKTFTDLIMFNPETQSYPKDDNYDPREARLYNATVRRYVESLNEIPDSILGIKDEKGRLIEPAKQINLEEQFNILSLLKKNINELGVKRQIAIIRKFLNTEFKFTHCMIDPNQAYSFVANFVPRGGSNPGPRWSYQSSMGVQALGVGNTVHYRRFETSNKRLISPTEHPFETVAELPCNQVSMPVTQNFIYLVAANYKGFEDPIILSKSALEKFGRYEKEVCVKIVETKNTNFNELIAFPVNKYGDPETKYMFRHLDKTGLPRLGSKIVVGDCLAGRIKVFTSEVAAASSNKTVIQSDSSIIAGVGTEGIVTAIHIIGSEGVENGFRTIIIKLSQRRKQQAGDKMAARFSQKGTIGDIIGGMINDGDPRLRIVDDCLMPYVAAGPNRGMRAEIVFNPASFPSRMTCGLIDEVLTSKASLYLQEKVDATSFHNLNHDYYRNALWENPIFDGMKDSNGNDFHLDINASEILCHSDGEIIMDTSTGKAKQFYMGLVAYQFLKHHVADKETARFRGTYNPITQQPVEGRHKGGGQRMGEMERDAIISSGASGVLLDRFMKCSDGYVGIYCYRCKNDSSISDIKTKTCAICGTVGTLCAVSEPRIYRVLRHQLCALGLNILETLKPVDDFDEEKLRSNQNDTMNIVNIIE